MVKNIKRKYLLWILIGNATVGIFFAGKYFYIVNREKQQEFRQTKATANTLVEIGAMSPSEATRFAVIADETDHGDHLSANDLAWCINLTRSHILGEAGAARSSTIMRELGKAAPMLDNSQKEVLFQAMAEQLKTDDPKDEMGSAVRGSAHVLGKLGDKRAIPILQSYCNDPRPMVHQTVLKAVNRLEGKATP
jgi:flagellar basal body-associated protein FliL